MFSKFRKHSFYLFELLCDTIIKNNERKPRYESINPVYRLHAELVGNATTSLDLPASSVFSGELIYMKNRTKAYIRYQRERIIRRKWTILKDVYQLEKESMPRRGTLSKGKVHCSCRICRYEQYYGIPKAKYKAIWKAMQQEIDD